MSPTQERFSSNLASNAIACLKMWKRKLRRLSLHDKGGPYSERQGNWRGELYKKKRYFYGKIAALRFAKKFEESRIFFEPLRKSPKANSLQLSCPQRKILEAIFKVLCTEWTMLMSDARKRKTGNDLMAEKQGNQAITFVHTLNNTFCSGRQHR